MKLKTKLISFVLALALAASAFCVQAVATSLNRYGIYNGQDWGANLRVTTKSVRGSIGYNGKNTDSVQLECFVVYTRDTGKGGTDYHEVTGKRTASYSNTYYYVYAGTIQWYINNTYIGYMVTTP